MREFDMDTLTLISAFENITGTEVRDCIIGDTLYFLVDTGKISKAIGKNGQNIKKAEYKLRKPIKIMEWAEDEIHKLADKNNLFDFTAIWKIREAFEDVMK